jgi:hypothetical protein
LWPYDLQSSRFASTTAHHKTVAILPVEVNIKLRANKKKKVTEEQLRELEEKTGNHIQEKMHAWFLNSSNKLKYTVGFQDVLTTNALEAV